MAHALNENLSQHVIAAYVCVCVCVCKFFHGRWWAHGGVESDRFRAGAGWNWKSGGYWRQDGEDIGGRMGRRRTIRTRRKGKGGKEKDVRYDMCAVQRAMRWMNPTGCWKATC